MENEWTNSRRNFVKTLVLSGVALQLPWLQSCSTEKKNIPIPDSIAPLSLDQFLTIHTVLDILFPDDGNGPGAIQLHADHYFLWTINDELIDPSTRSFFLDTLNELNDEAMRNYGKYFHDLSRSNQEDFIAELSVQKWSKGWLSRMLTLIFETLFLDAQYGVNPNNIGWDWLDYYPGYPRPSAELLYPTILNKKHEI